MCIYIYICICICMYVYIYIWYVWYICVCVCVCVFTCIRMYVYIYNIYMYICLYLCSHIHIYIYIYTYIHICMYVQLVSIAKGSISQSKVIKPVDLSHSDVWMHIQIWIQSFLTSRFFNGTYCLYACMYICICVWYKCVRVCVCVFVCVHDVCMLSYIYLYIYIFIHTRRFRFSNFTMNRRTWMRIVTAAMQRRHSSKNEGKQTLFDDKNVLDTFEAITSRFSEQMRQAAAWMDSRSIIASSKLVILLTACVHPFIYRSVNLFIICIAICLYLFTFKAAQLCLRFLSSSIYVLYAPWKWALKGVMD